MSLFQRERQLLQGLHPLRVQGRVRKVSGLIAEAEGLPLPVGSSCRIHCRAERRELEAEVVGFHDGRTLLVPCGVTQGIAPGDVVRHQGERLEVRVTPAMCGRILDGNGQPIDGRGPLAWIDRVPLYGRPVDPLVRQRITRPFSTGVKVIDSVLTCGRGQRLGIFAGSGVGKSVLLGMLARQSQAPVSVIGLIGERGREVREFIERDLGERGLQRSVVVVATSNDPPVLRLRAARVATSIAEYFRDRGEDVLLLLDSITRVALAQRELGLSAYEPPTTRAYPPSVFTLLAQLLERTGPGECGSITSFYSVLIEGDDLHDPIGDAVRGTLDGHIWLSRKLARRGHYPAVDVLDSISRVMKDVVTPEHQELAARLVADLARYRDVEDLLQLGAYVRGTDPETDGAVQRRKAIETLLRQRPEQDSDFEGALRELRAIYARRESAPAAGATGRPAAGGRPVATPIAPPGEGAP